MIALRGYDASVLEDDFFRSFVRSINPEFEVPSRVAIEDMCDGIFDKARRDLLDRLRRAPGKVNVAVATAKAMEEQFLYVVCHFIDDGWNLHKMLLHGVVTTDHHEDKDDQYWDMICRLLESFERVIQIISDHGIGDRLFMAADDKTFGPLVFGTYRDRKQILFTTYMDNVLHSIARCLLYHNEQCLHVYIKHLLLTRQGPLELLAELDLRYRWAYDEYWYACYCSLAVLRKTRRLTDAQLVITELLCHLWEKIYHAIQKNSSSTCPTANLCLPELFKLRETFQAKLAEFSSGDHGGFSHVSSEGKNVTHAGFSIEHYGDFPALTKSRDVTDVCRKANDTLDKAIQDSYLVWSLPLALDPRYKLQYIASNFETAYGLEAAKEYVSKVTAMITELYADYVKEYGTTDGADDPLEQQGMATQILSSCYPKAETELDRYLKDPPHDPQAEGFDILSWWKDHSSNYPIVARMARDALAMPTCSKLSSDQMAQVRSIVRGYSKKPYGSNTFPQ